MPTDPKPLKLRIEGKDFDVSVLDGMRNDGDCIPHRQVIYIERQCRPGHRAEVLLHELIHLVSPLDEVSTTALSSRLYGVLKDNGLWRDPWAEGHES